MAAHRSPETVRFGAREAGALHRDFQNLLLVENDTERLFQDWLQARMDVHHRFPALLAPQIRMYRVALDRAGADDGDLDDQIIERFRTRPRQCLHLRPALDLEDPDGVGFFAQLVDLRIFQVERIEVRADAGVGLD